MYKKMLTTMKNNQFSFVNKLTVGAVVIILTFFAGMTRTQAAVPYDSTGEINWCDAELLEQLNDDDWVDLLGDDQDFLDNLSEIEACNNNALENRVMSILSKSQWETYATTYQTAISTSLPDSALGVWTNTNNGSDQVYYFDGSSYSLTSPTTDTFDAVPVVMLSSDVCIASGTGTSQNPYVITDQNCNTAPTITISNYATDTIVSSNNGTFTLNGTVTDPDAGQEITITAVIGGVQKTWTMTSANNTVGLNGASWSLGPWTYAEMSESSSSATTVTVSDTIAGNYATHSAAVIVDKTAPTCSNGAWVPPTVSTYSSGSTTFTFSGGTDTGSVQSGIQVSGGSCTTTSPYSDGQTCTVTISDNADISTSCTSPEARYDGNQPAIECTLTKGTNSSYQEIIDDTIYYNPNQAGSFTVSAAIQSGQSNPSGVTNTLFTAYSGSGWTPSTNVTDTTSPYSQEYAWTSSATTSPGQQTVTMTFGNSLTSTCNYTVVADNAGPSGGSVSFADAYLNPTDTHSFNISLTRPTDTSGLADTSTWVIRRDQGTLSNGVCSNWAGTYATTVSSSDYTISNNSITVDDSTIQNGYCYRYSVEIGDKVGNTPVVLSDTTHAIKVSSSQGSVVPQEITDSSGAGMVHYDTTNNVLYVQTPASGDTVEFGFNVQATDATAGIDNVTFPSTIGTGIAIKTGTSNVIDSSDAVNDVYTATYVIDSTATTSPSGSFTITVLNNAGTSTTQTFTVVMDNTAPTTGTVTIPSEYVTQNSFTVQGTPGTDASSGRNDNATYFQYAYAPFDQTSPDGCGTFGTAYSIGQPAATSVGQTVDNAGCYKYWYHTEDMVGNVSDSAASIVKYDDANPVCGTWVPSTVDWKNATTASTQTFTMNDASDTGSGIASASYSCTAAATHNAQCSTADATIYDNAGRSTICPSPANQIDSEAPSISLTSSTGDCQSTQYNIVVSANDTTAISGGVSGTTRLAYAWNYLDVLGADCSGGTALSTDTTNNLSNAEGIQTLYVCAKDAAGNVTTSHDSYCYSSGPDQESAKIAGNGTSDTLAWNTKIVSASANNITIEGELAATSIPKEYTVQLYVPSLDEYFDAYTGSTSAGQPITTDTDSSVPFRIDIPLSAFNLSSDNFTFSGAHYLVLTDDDTGASVSIPYYVNFYFPIYNTRHRNNNGLFIYATDSRTN